MPQFAIFRNPGRKTDIPYLLQIQRTGLDYTAGRVVMALRRQFSGGPRDDAYTPHFRVRGETVFADPLNIASLPAARLGDVLEILPEPGQDRIIRAVDEMISRA